MQECRPALDTLLQRQGHLEIVLGGEGEQADPEALQELLQLTAGQERAAVRVVTDPARFHNAKTYYVSYPDGDAEAWVGSANLTQAGLHSNDETALTLESTVDDSDTLKQIHAGITAYRDDPATEALTSNAIRTIADRYAAVRGRRRPQSVALKPTERWQDLLRPTVDEIDTAASSGRNGEEPPLGVATGFAELDAVTGGLRPGTLTVVASRPGVGRSTLLLDVVRRCALKQNSGVVLFNLEVSDSEVSHRILSAEARIRLGDMRTGRMRDEDGTRLSRRMAGLVEAPLWLNSTPDAVVENLAAEATELCAQHRLSLIAVDSLPALTASLGVSASRERELSTAVRRLKTLALELDVPVVVTAELGRAIESRNDKRPTLGDLRESDTIHQVADNIILIHRPDSFERDHPRMGEADLILAKHRQGPPARITVAHQLHYSRFVDMAQE